MKNIGKFKVFSKYTSSIFLELKKVSHMTLFVMCFMLMFVAVFPVGTIFAADRGAFKENSKKYDRDFDNVLFNQNSFRNNSRGDRNDGDGQDNRQKDFDKTNLIKATTSVQTTVQSNNSASNTAQVSGSVYQNLEMKKVIATPIIRAQVNQARTNFSTGVGFRSPNSAVGLVDIFHPSNEYSGGLSPTATASATLGAMGFGLLGALMAAGKFALFG